jgi:5-methyltetrahydrofolate--homocysteine methyltransferase
VQAKELVEGGSDLLLVETCRDTRNIKAAILAIQTLSKEIGAPVPYGSSVTLEPMGTMLAGQTVEAMWSSLRHTQPIAFGMDRRACAPGKGNLPRLFREHSLM